jgi:hypothetical protein
MRTAYCGLAIWLSCSVPSLAQTSAQIKGPTEFKPADTIAITVTFAKKLPPGSSVMVIYKLQSGQSNTCRNFVDDALRWTGTSTNDQTFKLTFTVPESVVPGAYAFGELDVSSPGLQGNNVQKTMNAPIITVANAPCPKVVEIPSFQITAP